MAATVAPTPVSGGSLFGPPPSSRPLSPIKPSDHHESTPQLYHSDISSEVTALSNKLINAINYQTNLDDSLAAARMELEASRDRIRQLEHVNGEHEAMIADRTLVKRTEVESEIEELKEMLEEEKRQRATVEKEKKSIEQELENLTTALFEEANQMVAAARHERDAAERRNEQVKAQLKDAEELLASHQEQLAELKTVMQQMSTERDENDSNANNSTAPTSPLVGNQDQLGKLFDALHLYPHTPGSDDIPPSYPTSFSHLLQPVLRTDLSAYQDFTSLLRVSRNSPSPRTRSSTSTYGGLSMVGLGGFGNHSPSNASESSPSNGSSSALGMGATQSSSPATPSTPNPGQSNGLSKDAVPLKETRFYKRVLAEDIEPTLRLDTAPGLSWLARRTVINSMSEGNLVVEPLPTTPSLRVVTCALCGERRRGDDYARTHQFKTNEAENAQRYPLCKYCTGRVRATCDFLGFLRMVKDGHWRAESGDAEKAAWEESVKLRECMFWARIGGGVIPAFLQSKQSPRNSTTLERTEQEGKPSLEVVEEEVGKLDEEKSKGIEDDVFHSDEKRVSIGATVIYVDGAQQSSEGRAITEDKDVPTINEGQEVATKGSATNEAVSGMSELEGTSKESDNAETLSKPSGFSAGRGDQRLSITIPGSFD